MTDSLDRAYAERNILAAALLWRAAQEGHPVGWRDDTADGPDWPCVYADLPTGQVSWHFPRAEFTALFAGLPPYPHTYDGHDTGAKYARVLEWMGMLPGDAVRWLDEITGGAYSRQVVPRQAAPRQADR